jgi:hypothetical protein
MKITVDLPDLKQTVESAVEQAMVDIQAKLFGWKYFTLKEAAELLQIKTTTLLDKRMPFLNEIEYSQSGKLFWFLKASVENFINSRKIRKYRR